jgi:hypothetical protein
MKHEDILEQLGRVERIDPPPFLFTRIEARLAQYVAVPRGRLVAVACGLTLLLLLNVAVLARGPQNGSSLDGVVDGMGMNASNQLYR